MNETAYGTDDGFRRAMGRANRMRLRSLGTAAGAVAVAVALTGSLVPTHHAGGTSRLDMVTTPVTPRPTATAAVTPTPTPTPSPTVTPTAVAIGGSVTTVETGTYAVSRPAHSPTATAPDLAEPANPSRRPSPRRPQSTAMKQGTTGLGFECAAAATWCFRNDGFFRESPAHVWTLGSMLCGAEGAYDRVLRFPTSAEVEMSLADKHGRVVWSYLADHPAVTREHTLTFPGAALCLTWETRWYERGNDGTAVKPGDYTLVARLLASDPSVPDARTAFRLR